MAVSELSIKIKSKKFHHEIRWNSGKLTEICEFSSIQNLFHYKEKNIRAASFKFKIFDFGKMFVFKYALEKWNIKEVS